MSRLFHRLYGTSSSSLPNATETALAFLSQTASLPPRTHTQTLDLNQLQRLSCTLNRPLPSSPTAAIPACHHLVYFTPCQPEAELGPDGTDRTYSPPAPFTRRMWAGGELSWSATRNILRVGQTVTETTEVTSAEGKRTKSGEAMVVVGAEKRLENTEGVAVIDKRNWIFRPVLITPFPPAPKPSPMPFPEGKYTRDLTQTPVSLFRFSALTFNGHKIHYNRAWCQEVEGHRDLVVHGPLNLIHMVDFWRDVVGSGDEEFVPKKVVYRATGPVYVGEGYRIVMEEEKEGISEVRIVGGFGNVCMVGRIERFL